MKDCFDGRFQYSAVREADPSPYLQQWKVSFYSTPSSLVQGSYVVTTHYVRLEGEGEPEPTAEEVVQTIRRTVEEFERFEDLADWLEEGYLSEGCCASTIRAGIQRYRELESMVRRIRGVFKDILQEGCDEIG